MKSLEEIKEGLKTCIDYRMNNCIGCPYKDISKMRCRGLKYYELIAINELESVLQKALQALVDSESDVPCEMLNSEEPCCGFCEEHCTENGPDAECWKFYLAWDGKEKV